jgi:hypothetical protein
LTGLDRDSIEMREVSPMGGLLSQDERMDVWVERIVTAVDASSIFIVSCSSATM